jgi:hypothetical protein
MTDDFFPRLWSRQSTDGDAVTRRAAEGLPATQPAFVGRVFAQLAVPTSPGRFASVHPVAVLGAEGEANPGTLLVDTSTMVLVYLLGPGVPAAGDDLVCRFVGHRWVAERMDDGGGTMISLPGCPCAAIPSVLHMTSGDTTCDGGMFQNCVLAYGPTPSVYTPLGLGASCFLSTGSFTDGNTGDSFQYTFSCGPSGYTLSRVYAVSIFGSPYKDVVRYTWVIGEFGNTCTPFLLNRGQPNSACDPATVVTISP